MAALAGKEWNLIKLCTAGRVAANKENKSRVAGHCLSQGKTLPTPNLIKKEDKRVSYTFAEPYAG